MKYFIFNIQHKIIIFLCNLTWIHENWKSVFFVDFSKNIIFTVCLLDRLTESLIGMVSEIQELKSIENSGGRNGIINKKLLLASF